MWVDSHGFGSMSCNDAQDDKNMFLSLRQYFPLSWTVGPHIGVLAEVGESLCGTYLQPKRDYDILYTHI